MPKTIYKLPKNGFSKKTLLQELWVDKRTEYGVTFKNFCKEKHIEVYSTMSESKTAIAERERVRERKRKHCSLENI